MSIQRNRLAEQEREGESKAFEAISPIGAPVNASRIIHSEYERNPLRSVLALGWSEYDLKDDTAPSVIGAWDEKLGRFVMVASKCIDGAWVSMPYELLINGESPKVEWLAVQRPAVSLPNPMQVAESAVVLEVK